MDFRPLDAMEQAQLLAALRGNAHEGRTIVIDRRDTGFAGASEEVTDEEVIAAIRSVPCHY